MFAFATGIDVDSVGKVYVANGFTTTVSVFAATASGNVAPMSGYSGASTGIVGPSALAVTPPMSIVTRTLPRGRVSTPYRARLRAAEGTTPYHWSLARGALPPGLHLSGDGVISGVPHSAGRWALAVRLRDAEHPARTLTRRLQITIAPNTARGGS